MSNLPEGLRAEVEQRVARIRASMRERGLDALLVYGDNKVAGSLRYASGYFPDRAGWISRGPFRSDIHIFAGAAVYVPLEGEVALLIEPGHMLDQDPCVDRVIPSAQGLSAGGEGLTPPTVAQLAGELGPRPRIGIETWERFPAPLYLGIQELLPGAEILESTIVEELRLVKSPWEVEVIRGAGRVADIGHRAMCDALRTGAGRSEVELVRVADQAMREADPIFEETVPSSPSKICSGSTVRGLLLHIPLPGKRVDRGDVVNWDICMRYCGYTVDTSRTRVLGAATEEQRRAYEVTMFMFDAILAAAKPGVPAASLVGVATEVAADHGFELWERFVGHGTGLDCHERPDMGLEETLLAEHMVLCIEPRIALDSRYLVANEDMVLVTANGGESLNLFPKTPLEL